MSIPPEEPTDPETAVTETAEAAREEAETSESAETTAAPAQVKRTSLDLRSAAVPVLVVIMVSVFIVYPYVKELLDNGPQAIVAGGKPALNPSQLAESQEEAVALLGDVKVGAKVKDFKVLSVRGPRMKRIEVELERSDQVLRVFVSRLDSVKLIPPRKTQMYAIYYESAKPDPGAVTSEEYLALVEAVGAAVEANERKVSMPDGL